MKITFELPEYDNAWCVARNIFEAPLPVRPCYGCRKPTDGPMVRFALDWWHVSCLEETFAWKAVQGSVLAAWIHIAIDVGKYPSKHTATEIRAVIQNLIAGPMMTALWKAGKEEAARDLREDMGDAGPPAPADDVPERDGDSYGYTAVTR